MNVCPNCHKEVMEGFDTCFSCGASLMEESVDEVTNQFNQLQQHQDTSLLFLVIAFFFPLFGLLIALLVKSSNEKLAKLMFVVIFISIVFYSMMIAMLGFFIAI